MAVIIKSNDMSWLDVSDVWYNDMGPNGICTNLKGALQSIKDAEKLISKTEGLTSMSVSETDNDVEHLIEDLRRFVFFANGIHYEISEFVDNPFSLDMGSAAEDIIDLNPSDYKYVKSKFLFIKNYLSLTDLVSATIDDDALKKSFDDMAKKLDKDKMSKELKRSIEEAEFWKEQFDLAERIDKATDEYFTPELRAAWPTMTEAERKKCVQEYKDILSKQFGGFWGLVHKKVTFTESGYGCAYGNNHIGINPLFVTAPVGMYSLDKLIDTMTHEMRHRYQDKNDHKKSTAKNIRDEWNRPYIESDKDYDGYYRQPVEEDAKAFAALAQDDD